MTTPQCVTRNLLNVLIGRAEDGVDNVDDAVVCIHVSVLNDGRDDAVGVKVIPDILPTDYDRFFLAVVIDGERGAGERGECRRLVVCGSQAALLQLCEGEDALEQVVFFRVWVKS